VRINGVIRIEMLALNPKYRIKIGIQVTKVIASYILSIFEVKNINLHK
jgi:hypothetical protein